jgi:cytochrome c oxidase cbb3-type subunit 3
MHVFIMNPVRYRLRWSIFGAAALLVGGCFAAPQKTPQQTPQATPSAQRNPKTPSQTFSPALVESGHSLFEQNCAFCHGRDAGGGETGPDLTRSKLVAEDADGDKIGYVVSNGRPDKGMPRFSFSAQQLSELAAFIHTAKIKAESQKGGRRGVDVSDLQTGNVEEGKKYFNGAGTCSTCHSATGDLAGVASRYEGLKLEERMLYPEHVTSDVTVTLPSGQTLQGKLAYQDEFTIGMRDASGWYRSWPVTAVKYSVRAPAEAHADLLGKYTDADIHNLMAYLQTLR